VVKRSVNTMRPINLPLRKPDRPGKRRRESLEDMRRLMRPPHAASTRFSHGFRFGFA
jgi:hypothetical protein